MTKKQVAFLAAVGVMSAVFAFAQTGGTICIQENSVNKGCVQYLNFQGDTAAWVNRNVAFLGISDAGVAFARYAADAGHANNADNATTAGTATYALDAGQANYAPQAGNANTANTATYAADAGYANTAGTAGSAGTCDVATYALDAGRANYAPAAGVAVYALDAGAANYATSAGSAGTATTATYAADAGNVVCTGCIIADRIALGAIIREKIAAGAVNHTVIEDGGILGNNIIPGGVTSTQIAAGGVATANIATGAVTANELGALAVTEAKINTGAVTNTKLGDLSISTGKLQDLAISTDKLSNLAVTEGKLGALSVTEGKIGALAVSSGKLQDSAVIEAKLATGAVTNTKIGALAVDSAKLADGSVIEAKVGTGAITNTKIGALAVDSAKLAAAAVTTAKIATGAVTSNELGAAAVTTAKIATGAVTSNELGAAAVTTAKLATGAVTTNELGALAVTTAKIASGAVTTNELGANAVTNAKLASLSVATGNIQTGAVTANELGSGSVTNAKLGLLSVATGNLQDTAVTTAKIADSNVTTAKVANSAITEDKVDFGIPFNAYDEAAGSGAIIFGRVTLATNCTWENGGSSRRYSIANVSTLQTDPVLTTDIYTGTTTSQYTTHAMMTYRFRGGLVNNVTQAAFANPATSQIVYAPVVADGGWHSVAADISAFTSVSGLQVAIDTGTLGSAGFWDIAYLGTGIIGGGTGSLVSYRGNVSVGAASSSTRLSVAPLASHGAPSPGTASGGFSLLGNNNLYGLYAGVDSSGAAWWQAMRNDGTATAYSLWLNPSGGNVGIGTSGPSERLTVAAGANDRVGAGVSSAISTLYLGSKLAGESVRTIDFDRGTGAWTLKGGNTGSALTTFLNLGTTVSTPSTGKLGVGAGTWTSNGNDIFLNTNGSSTVYLRPGGDGSTNWQYEASSSSTYHRWLGASGAELARLTGTGLGVGGTASVRLHTFATNENLRMEGTDPWASFYQSGTRKGWFGYGATAGTTEWGFNNEVTNGFFNFRVNGTGNLRASYLTGVGNRAIYVDANGGFTTSSSDGTLKEDVQDLRATLRNALQLRPVSFLWKDKERFGPQREIGFIAQEVMQVVPEVVGRNNDGTYTIDYPKIVAVLAGAIQELFDDRTWLARRVQELEDRAQKAEDKLAQLEARLLSLENYSGIKGCGNCPQVDDGENPP